MQTTNKNEYILITANKSRVANSDQKPMSLDGVLQEIAQRGDLMNFLLESSDGVARCTFLVKRDWLVVYSTTAGMSTLLRSLEQVCRDHKANRVLN